MCSTNGCCFTYFLRFTVDGSWYSWVYLIFSTLYTCTVPVYLSFARSTRTYSTIEALEAEACGSLGRD